MKKIVKRMIAVALTVVITGSTPITAVAVEHKPGCGATTQVQKCGSYVSSTVDQHTLHTNVKCTRTGYLYKHYYVCANCGVQTANGSIKMCTRAHSICTPGETGLCQ